MTMSGLYHISNGIYLKWWNTILKKFHESSKIELEVSNTKIFLKRQYLFFLTKFYKVLSSLNFQALINKVWKAIPMQNKATYGLSRSPTRAHFQNVPKRPVFLRSNKFGHKDRM